MQIYKNVPLKKYNTFGIDYIADCIIDIKTETEAINLCRKADVWKNPPLILGGGSNILFTSDFNGTILRPQMKGIRIESNDGDKVIISAGSGVIWDKLVEWTVRNGFSGFRYRSIGKRFCSYHH